MSVREAPNRRHWRCDNCDRLDVWGDTWQWFGSTRDMDDSKWDRIEVSCSDECRAVLDAEREAS
jgi:hypothetical protein